MHTRASLQNLARTRLEDATLLFQCNRPCSAYYLAGYAIELALKACISRLMRPDTIPDKGFINAIYTHKFDELVSVAGLRPDFSAEMKTDLQFAAYWAIVSNWSESSRYETWDAISAATLLKAICDPDHGVFRWVKKYW